MKYYDYNWDPMLVVKYYHWKFQLRPLADGQQLRLVTHVGNSVTVNAWEQVWPADYLLGSFVILVGTKSECENIKTKNTIFSSNNSSDSHKPSTTFGNKNSKVLMVLPNKVTGGSRNYMQRRLMEHCFLLATWRFYFCWSEAVVLSLCRITLKLKIDK